MLQIQRFLEHLINGFCNTLVSLYIFNLRANCLKLYRVKNTSDWDKKTESLFISVFFQFVPIATRPK